MMSGKTDTIIRLLVPTLFFFSIFLYFAHPLHDGDMWIHLNHGRWLLENGVFPSGDPFAYTTTPEYSTRAFLFNRAYWLAQTFYYLIYTHSGFAGLKYFHAASFTMIFYLLWAIIRKQGLPRFVALAILIPCFWLSLPFDDLRPKIFLYLALPLLYLIIETGLTRLRKDQSILTLPLIAISLPLAILCTANLYRGFPIIYPFMTAYIAGESAAYRFGEQWKNFRVFILWITLSLLFTFMNPALFYPLLESVREMFQDSAAFEIIELMPPWSASIISSGGSYFYICLLAAFTLAASFVIWLKRRSVSCAHWLLLAGFAFMGATAFRFTFYFVLIGTVIAARYAAGLSALSSRWLHHASLALVGIFSVYLLTTSFNNIKGAEAHIVTAVYPDMAIDFMQTNRLPQPILNNYRWGGYITWRTGAEYKVFIDSRMVDFSVYRKLAKTEATEPVRTLLDLYGINTVIYPHIERGNISNVVLDLLSDESWPLAYMDNKAVIFVRKGSRGFSAGLDKAQLTAFLLRHAEEKIRTKPNSHEGYFDLADIYSATGNSSAAKESFDKGNNILRRQ